MESLEIIGIVGNVGKRVHRTTEGRLCVERNGESWTRFAESAPEGRLCVERNGKSWIRFAESATEGTLCVERNGKS